LRQQRITNRGEPIYLGRCGEHDATLISYDIPDDWQDGVIQLFVLRMSDTEAYVPGGFYVQDGVAYWRVSAADTSVTGRGLAQFCSIKGGVIEKSKAFTTITDESAGDLDTVVPEPQKSVLEAALESASEFAGKALTAAGTAQNAAQEASEAADKAEGAAYEWFTLSVDESTGQLVVTERDRDGNDL
jgi:hypothetical protein